MLKGKTAIVTGGTRGIGRAIALVFAENGANVLITGSKESDAADSTVEEIKAKGVEALFFAGDVAEFENAKKAVELCKESFGTIDILVNNAGINNDKLLMRMSDEDFAQVVDVNLKGSFNFLKLASKIMMKQREGVIINMASVAGVNGNAGQVNYSASKAGVIGMTKAAAKELGSRNIRVNAIAPGFIETDMTAAMPEESKDAAIKSISLGRAGSPVEVANVALFLASDMSAYVTGQTIVVDGAIMM